MDTIDISSDNTKGECNLKCQYSFQYSNSSCVVRNNATNIQLSYDKTNVPPVSFNSNKYNVENVSMYSPSIHKFNVNFTDGEIVIYHYPESGGQPLYVSIPIMSSGTTSGSSSLISNLVQAISTSAPSQGATSNLPVSNYNLNSIVPNKPYFSYTDTSNNNWIVYGKEHAIALSQSNISVLQNTLSPANSAVLCPAGPPVYMNSKGPAADVSGSDIYIDCQPTGASTEQTTTQSNSGGSSNSVDFDLSSITQSPYYNDIIQILITGLIVIALMILLYYGFKNITKLKKMSFNGSKGT